MNDDKRHETKFTHLAIVAVAFVICGLGFSLREWYYHSVRSQETRTQTTKTNKSKATTSSSSSVQKSTAAYNNNGYKYLYETKISPVTGNGSEHATDKFSGTYQMLLTNAYAGRFDETNETDAQKLFVKIKLERE